jgi:hypothetical protein
MLRVYGQLKRNARKFLAKTRIRCKFIVGKARSGEARPSEARYARTRKGAVSFGVVGLLF